MALQAATIFDRHGVGIKPLIKCVKSASTKSLCIVKISFSLGDFEMRWACSAELGETDNLNYSKSRQFSLAKPLGFGS